MSGERQFWGDCRDDANFGKPLTDEELARIRALQAARMRFATVPLPLHSSTGADGRWLATVDALTAERDALAALVAGAYEKCAKVAEDCACPLAREGIKSNRYGFCGHARCGHFHEAADAIRALARIDAASGSKA